MGFANILDSLGWAILHSMWQGALLALAVFMFRSLTRDSQASLRCGFQVLCLMTALLAFAGTFIFYQFTGFGGASSVPATSLFGLGGGELSFDPGSTDAVVAGVGTSFSPALDAYIPWIGTIWTIGFAVLSVKYVLALIMTQQLRTRGVTPAPHFWQNRFRTLVLNAGIRRQIEILISNRVTGPLTLGFYKPVVLVPASFFTGLPHEQIEAILLHEIAHIRRHDYLINLLQTAIKTVFFYHPAVRYISNRIDDDRERACDDFAVALTRDPQSLAKGLAALRLSLTPKTFALAANDGKSPLMARLNRLVDNEDVSRRPEQVVASVGALIVAAGLYANFSPLANAHPDDATTEPNIIEHPNGDKDNYRFEAKSNNGKSFMIKVADNGTEWVSKDGMWFDIAKHPSVVKDLPAIPKAPKVPNPDQFTSYMKFKSKASQYKVDLDYYIASLENQMRAGNKGVDLTVQLEKANQQRDLLKDPNFDYKTDYHYRVAPVAEPYPISAPAPAPAPVIKVSSVDLVDEKKLAPGIYIDGNRVETEDWSDELENRLEHAVDEFEHKMEHVEEDFEAAMEKFDSYLDYADQNPDKAEAKIKKANEKLAKAAIKANQERDELSEILDQQITEILKEANILAEQTQKITETKVAEALAQVQHELAEADFENKWDQEAFQIEMRELQRELKAQKAELLRDSRVNREEVLREAKEARTEALRSQKEAHAIARHAQARAQKDAQEARRQAKEQAYLAQQEAKQYAELRTNKEAEHVKNDYREFRNEMMNQLRSDGLISRSDQTATVTFKDKDMFVNGVQVQNDLEDNYCEINEEFHIYKNDNAVIRLLPNGVELENSYFKFGDTHSTRWTYSQK